MRILWFLLILSSCGYRYQGQEEALDRHYTVTVPYMEGDVGAELNRELVYQLSSFSCFTPLQTGGETTLKVTVLSDTKERIGFRYDRDNPSAHLEKNLLGVEDRRKVVVEVSLLDTTTDKVLVGPRRVSAFIDYDYTDPGSPRDLLFAHHEPVMEFSLGQLDSSEGAHDESARPLFRKLAQKIVVGLVEQLR